MTVQEAISELKFAKDNAYSADEANCVPIVAIDMAISALEKQIPKKTKVLLKGTTDWNTKCVCQNCKGFIFGKPKYCECGQALDWSDEE